MRHLNKKYWPYQTESSSDHKEIKEWCKNSVGYLWHDWYYYSSSSTHYYAFKEVESLLLFKLKWSKNGN